jgi:hypothetical protein
MKLNLCFLVTLCLISHIDCACLQSEYESIACDGEIITLQCPNGRYISINNIFYGRDDKQTCYDKCISERNATDCVNTHLNNDNCYTAALDPLVRNNCQAKESCAFGFNTYHLGIPDPCLFIIKFLRVKYRCIEMLFEP